MQRRQHPSVTQAVVVGPCLGRKLQQCPKAGLAERDQQVQLPPTEPAVPG